MNPNEPNSNPPPLRRRETHPQGAREGGARSVLADISLGFQRGASKRTKPFHQRSLGERPPSASCYAQVGFAGCSLPLKGGESIIMAVCVERRLQIAVAYA
jgi:hypothetical protein